MKDEVHERHRDTLLFVGRALASLRIAAVEQGELECQRSLIETQKDLEGIEARLTKLLQRKS